MLRKSTVAMVGALVAAAATPSYASTMTYDFAVRIGATTVFNEDFTLMSVQSGDVIHGSITLDTSVPDSNASPDIGQYHATSGPSVLSVTFGPNNPWPQETFSTSNFDVRIAENGRGFFGAEEFFIINDGPFVANGDQVDTFEIRLDSDSLAFLTGTGFPSAVDLGLLNSHSIFEFIGHDAQGFDGFELLGAITDFHVATDAEVVPEPGSLVLLVGGLVALAGRQRLRAKRVGPAGS